MNIHASTSQLRLSTIVAIGVTVTYSFLACDAFANTEEKAKRLAVEYSNAQTSGNKELKSKLYDEIIADKEVAEHIRDNYRDTYHLLRLQSTEKKLDSMQRRYGSRAPRTRAPRSGGTVLQSGRPTASSPGSNSGAPDSNRTYTQNFANKNRDPNRVRSSLSNSRVRFSNSRATRSFSNRSRARSQSNQRRIRNRR